MFKPEEQTHVSSDLSPTRQMENDNEVKEVTQTSSNGTITNKRPAIISDKR